MQSLETPPSPAQFPGPPNPPVKVRTGRFGELDEHELIHLLDSLDDERAKARFREAIYISVIFYLAVVWFLFYGPRVLFHQPKLISPVDILKERDKELTYLDMPKDVAKQLQHKPTNVMSDKDRTQQTAKPTLDKKTLEQLQAMRRAGTPEPPPAAPAYSTEAGSATAAGGPAAAAVAGESPAAGDGGCASARSEGEFWAAEHVGGRGAEAGGAGSGAGTWAEWEFWPRGAGLP